MPHQLTRGFGGAVLTVVLFLLAGALAGAVWWWAWEAPSGMVRDGRWYPQPWDVGQQADFAGQAWYVVVAAVTGLLGGALATLGRARGELLTLGSVLLGSVAGGVVMRLVGQALAPEDPHVLARTADDGARLSGTLHLAGPVWWLAMPFGALLAVAAVFLLLAPPVLRLADTQAG